MKHARNASTDPPRRAVQAALRKTTETLAVELARPGRVAPQWTQFEWRVARAVASMHGVSTLLCASQWHGPADWVQFLTDQHRHTAQRYERTRELLQLIDAHARAFGVPLIALKGAALHALGVYTAGERPMADVDLLAREQDSAQAQRLLEGLGFRESFATWKHRVFEPNKPQAAAAFGEHANNAMKIELHTAIKEALPVRAVDISAQIFSLELRPGLNGYPSRAALMSHLLLHASGAMVFRGLRLINLHDIARLSALMTDQDWEEFLAQGGARSEQLWWAYPPLALTAHYFGCVAERILSAAAADCPWLLRRATRRHSVTDVSFSHLWISALPGIEWSPSLPEMLHYIARRLLPDAELRAMREVIATTMPCAADNAWARMSQGRRMLRWLMGRQMRAETARPVRLALTRPQ